MSLLTRGESKRVRPTHPEGKIPEGIGLGGDSHWGDYHGKHKELRMGYMNIGTFPSDVTNHKNGSIRQLMNDNHIDCLGMSEMNTYWPAHSTQQQIQERTRGWFDDTVAAATYNKHNTKIRKQQGGCAIIAKGQLANRSGKRIYDTLGRWMMMSFRGKNGLLLRVVSAYRPRSTDGPFTIYQQLLHHYEEKDTVCDNTDPLVNYDNDLTDLISGWMDDGDQVIVMIDSNVDLANTKKGTFRHTLEDIGMHELLLSQHPTLKPPATRFPGRLPIDGIFGTPALEINQGGYSQFTGISDHRFAWVDIKWKSALGTYQLIQRPIARRLQCDDPRSVAKYIQIIEQLLHKADICSGIMQLEEEATVPLTNAAVEAYEAFDKAITRIMLLAEKKCRKLFMGGVPFSPDLARHLNLINFWRLLIRKKKGSCSNMRTIIRLQKAVDIFGKPLDSDLQSMYLQYKQVIFDYRTFRKTASTSRSTFQDKRIEEYALQGNLEACTVRKNIKNKEAKRSQNRRIQSMIGNKRGPGVTQVETMDPLTNESHTCTSKQEVEAAHIKYLPELFLCGDETPLRQNPLLKAFGYRGDTVRGDEVTAGTYIPPPDTDEYTKLFLKCMKRPDHVPESAIPDIFSTNDYVKRWKSRREKTSSSRSGRHFGHYKLQHKLKQKYKDMFATMANIPYRTGYSVKRWQKVIDVLIMKNENDFRVHRTRPIPLTEADGNENSKRMARDAMTAAEIYNILANEQYGSRQHRSAIHLATNKRLIYDISRQMKRLMAVCSNDARSCYDRIVHVAAYLALRRLGVPKPMIISMLITIQEMEHSIRTSFGDSSITYGGKEWRLKPHGSVQGNGASPLIWAAISTVLFLALNEKNYGGIFRAPITKLLKKTCGIRICR